MPGYVAFLRGINVGGGRIIKMEALREMLTDMGFKNVSTYIQSGNVVFDSSKKNGDKLAVEIEKQIEKTFGHDVPTMVRSAAEMDAIITHNPFGAPEKGVTNLYVCLLSEIPGKKQQKALKALESEIDQFHINDRELYWFTNKSVGTSALPGNFVEKKLGVFATNRNWNTMEKMLAMAKAIDV